jgi:uridine kinase
MMSFVADIRYKSRLDRMLRRSEKDQLALGIRTFEDVNQSIADGRFNDLIRRCEEDYANRLEGIVRLIARNRGQTRLICLAGPSSSGKTTTSMRLSDGLSRHGILAVPLAMDNYFKDREFTPKDENGEYDFEDVGALDTELLNAQLRDLIAGKEVIPPVYNFKTGKQERAPAPLKLSEGQVLVMEGIHALNGSLTTGVARQSKFYLYVTAMTRLKNHKDHFLHSTDNRFVRRIVRDSLFRGYGAFETIERWPSVMRGEQRNIFPFQEQADAIFNSALPYEYPVLKRLAFDLLVEINKRVEVFLEARKLLSVLNYFSFAPEESLAEIPADSVIREFIGGSRYKY